MSQDDFDSVSVSIGGIGGEYDTITIDPAVYTSVTGPVWTTGTNGITWQTDDFDFTNIRPSGKIQLEGEDADIEINGRSLMAILDGIEQRLGLVKMRQDLEADWAELREFGEQYRSKLAEIENKTKMWNTLKK